MIAECFYCGNQAECEEWLRGHPERAIVLEESLDALAYSARCQWPEGETYHDELDILDALAGALKRAEQQTDDPLVTLTADTEPVHSAERQNREEDHGHALDD